MLSVVFPTIEILRIGMIFQQSVFPTLLLRFDMTVFSARKLRIFGLSDPVA